MTSANYYLAESNYRHNFSDECQGVTSRFLTDDDGNPMGGVTPGPGFKIVWQNGTVRSPEDINGANVVDVLTAALQRLHFFNNGKFQCEENDFAITHLKEAVSWLEKRIADRIERGVLSTMEK
jgi:hypothetical protein